jgi:23S rRNA (uracil1939-C5)-methyltransferase
MIQPLYENVEILDAGSEGNAVARVGDLVIFVPFVVPGDVVDIRPTRRKKSFLEGRAVRFHRYSEKRAEPFCSHFGTCGGCRWQNMKYEEQLFFKQKQVADAFERIGKIDRAGILPILPSPSTTYYRNKLEFTFSNRRWLEQQDKTLHPGDREMNALGFHLPLLFDRVLDIGTCWLQPDPSNAIRHETKKYALGNGLSFYDVRTWQGFLRNLIVRTTGTGGVMVILVTRNDEKEEISRMLGHLSGRFPEITSLFHVINPKRNDVISDLPHLLFKGDPWIEEKMKDYREKKEILFRIGPASFFQTNTEQALALYRVASEFAGFEGHETVYDLYSGTGAIADFIASSVQKVIGIESVAAAVEDARENAGRNGIDNVFFFPGELEKTLNADFIRQNGAPHIVITDPPRAGMHEKVTRAILSAAPRKVVYISCNPATQARDVSILKEKYDLVKCRPVDMFPHTQHVENVALLVRRN